MAALIKVWSEIWIREASRERPRHPPHVGEPLCWLLNPNDTGPWREKCAQWRSTYPSRSLGLIEIEERVEYLRNQGMFQPLYETVEMDYED